MGMGLGPRTPVVFSLPPEDNIGNNDRIGDLTELGMAESQSRFFSSTT